MRVIQKKVCLLGDFGVGKTSLVSRFVKNEFSEKYLTTLGVKMDTKQVSVAADLDVKVILWDISGDSTINAKTASYLRGSAGFIFVADGTRLNTIESVFQLKKDAENLLGQLPFVLLINKHDLIAEWDIPETLLNQIKESGWHVLYTSAKTGQNVEQAFITLAQNLVA